MRQEYQNIVKQVLGYFWKHVWQDENFINALTEIQGLLFEQSLSNQGALGNYLTIDEIPLTQHTRWEFLSSVRTEVEETTEVYDSSKFYGTDLDYGDTSLPVFYKVPIHKKTSLHTSFLLDSPGRPSLFLMEGFDYIIRDGCFIFKKHPFTLGFKTSNLEIDGVLTTSIKYWGYRCEEDKLRPSKHFGALVGINAESTENNKKLMCALWNLRTQGGTTLNINKYLSCFIKSDIPTRDGKVQDIWQEADALHIATEDEITSIQNTDASAVVSIGDTVKQGDLLFDTIKIKQANDYLDPLNYPAFILSEGLLGNKYKGSLVFHNKEYPLSFKYYTSHPDIKLLRDEEGSLLYTINKKNEKIILTEAEADGAYALVPFFPIYGDPEDVELFRHTMAANSYKYKIDLKEYLLRGQRAPFTINPLHFIQQDVFAHNTLFISITDLNYFKDKNVCSSFNLFKNTLPVGTTYTLNINKELTKDDYFCDSAIEETLLPFIVYDTEDEYDEYSDELKITKERVG